MSMDDRKSRVANIEKRRARFDMNEMACGLL